MHRITAMSKISTLTTSKGQDISVYIRERKGGHGAPYILAKQPDTATIHVRIDNLKTATYNLKYLLKWMQAYKKELLDSWKSSSKGGKALTVPSKMPKPTATSTLRITKIKEIKTNKNLFMAIRFENNEIRIVDFKTDFIPFNTAFKVLQDPKIFMQAKAEKSGVRWEEADIDIEGTELYDYSQPVDLTDLKI